MVLPCLRSGAGAGARGPEPFDTKSASFAITFHDEIPRVPRRRRGGHARRGRRIQRRRRPAWRLRRINGRWVARAAGRPPVEVDRAESPRHLSDLRSTAPARSDAIAVHAFVMVLGDGGQRTAC